MTVSTQTEIDECPVRMRGTVTTMVWKGKQDVYLLTSIIRLLKVTCVKRVMTGTTTAMWVILTKITE